MTEKIDAQQQAFGLWVLAFARTTAQHTLPSLSTRDALRVPRFVREHAGIDSDLAQRAVILLFDFAAKDQLRVGVAMQPTIVLDFAFELTRGPAGITQREDRVFRAGAPGDRLENIDGGGQADFVVDP